MNGRDDGKRLVPAVDVRINGNRIPAQTLADLVAVTVQEDLYAPAMFTLRLVNWDFEKLQVTWSDDRLFAEGNEVDILMGYPGDLKTVIVGEITGLELEFNVEQTLMLIVRGYDRRHRLLRGRKTRSFVQMTDSQIASQVAAGAGLSAEVVDSQVKLEYVLQHNQTDLEFLLERARLIGYEVLVVKKTLFFRPAQIARQSALTLSAQGDLLEFSPRSTTLGQVGEVEVRGWNPQEKQVITGKAHRAEKFLGKTGGPQAADKAFGKVSRLSVDRPVINRAEAEKIAQGLFNEMALSYIGGEGACEGRPDLRPGLIVDIQGLGKRFSGAYYITATSHEISPALGYQTAFTVRRNAT